MKTASARPPAALRTVEQAASTTVAELVADAIAERRTSVAELLYEPSEILSLNEAVRLSGIGLVSLKAAIADGRLSATFDRKPPVRGAGRAGNPLRWNIRVSDLTSFIAALEPCRYPRCERLGAGPTGCCSGPHAQGVLMRGVARPEVGAKMSATMRGKPRRPRGRCENIARGLERFWSSDASRGERAKRADRARDPQVQFDRAVGRWPGSARRAGAKLRQALVRMRGGQPRKTELHGRWLAMHDGRDRELEDLLACGDMTRMRTIAWLDWQRHPEDWPRDKWPASRTDVDDIDDNFLRGAEARVRQAVRSLQKYLQTV